MYLKADTFGARLRILRKEKGLHQSELGEMFGLSPSAIGSYERDLREPSYNHLIAFANFFQVSIDYLLCRTDERQMLDDYFSHDNVEFFELMNKSNVTINGYEVTSSDKRRLFDIAVGLFWSKFSEGNENTNSNNTD
ncbi:MAG: helix-turn-helix domain-containing protein [Bacillus sp. (in: firmicutes)]